MRPIPYLLPVAAMLAIAAFAVWTFSTALIAAVALGGTPHHLVLALFSLLAGFSTGRLLEHKIRLPGLFFIVLPAVATASAWFLFSRSDFPLWHSLALNVTILALLGTGVGYGLSPCLPRGTTAIAVSTVLVLAIAATPVVLYTVGPAIPLAVGSILAFLAPATMVSQLGYDDKRLESELRSRGDKTARSAWIPRMLAAIFVSGIAVAALHAMESGRHQRHEPTWWAVGVTVLVSMALPRLAQREALLDKPWRRFLKPLGWAIAGTVCAVALIAAPAWPVRLGPSGNPPFLDGTTLSLLALVAAGGAALVTTQMLPPPMSLNLLLTSVGGILWEQAAMPLLGSEGLLRFLGTTGYTLAAISALIRLRVDRGQLFTSVALAVAAGALALVPLFWSPWEPAPELTANLPASEHPQSPPLPASISYREDQHGPLVAVQKGDVSRLYVRGYPTRPRQPSDTDPLLVALPTLLQPHASQILFAGSGSGAGLELLLSRNPIRLVWLNVSMARATAIRTLGTAVSRVISDPRLVVDFESLRPLSRREPHRFDAISVLAPPLNTLERDHVYSLQGFHAIKRLLTPKGIAVVELPLDGGHIWVLRVLATFHDVFPEGMVWLCPGVTSSLAITSGPGQSRVSIASIEKGLAEPELAKRLRAAGINTTEDVLEHLLLVPPGLETVTNLPLSDLHPEAEHETRGAEALLATLLPALRPLNGFVDASGSRYQTGTIQQILDEVTEHHRAYLSMLTELDRGVFNKVVDEAHKLIRGPRSRHSELDILTRPYLVRAKEYLRTDQLDRAIEQLSVVRMVDPGRADVPLLLGRTYEKKGMKKQAESLYDEAIRLAPESAEARVRLAGVYEEEGRYREAISLLEQATTMRPADAVLFHNLGTLHLAVGELDKAKKYFEQAIQLDEKLGQAHAGLAEVLFRMGRNDAAAVEANIAVRLDPSADSLNLMGQIALRQGDMQKARTAFLRCLLKDPDHIEARGAMGIIAAEQGDVETARKSWNKILQMDPTNRAAKENLKRLDEAYPPLPYDK